MPCRQKKQPVKTKGEIAMRTERNQIYKCKLCGQVLEVLDGGMPPVCCGEPMTLQTPNTVEASREKHIPVIEVLGSGILVKIGSEPHPMTEEHYIEWIEVINGCYTNRYHFKPGDRPHVAFYVTMQPNLVVRAYCNIHGLWQNK